jgi:low temperature requirement protein LtrA
VPKVPAAAAERDEEQFRVSTLELFFDLVFVFTLTQLTTVLYDEFTFTGLLQIGLMLAVIWWMYGGYVWLTNAVAADRTARRLLLIGGMGTYLVLALSILEAFGDSGLAFGLAYAVVILIHAGLFSRAAHARIWELAPYNLVCAALVVAGGIAGDDAQYVLWALAACVWVTPRLIDDSAFRIAVSHFVERHGLVVIVAIGESIVAIGIGAEGVPVDLPLVLVASLGLALSSCLWWAYFRGDDELAEIALATAPQARRNRLATDAFGMAHYLLLLGIIAIAAAEKKAIGHAYDPLSFAEALALAGGLSVFLVGDVLFRRWLAIGRVDLRLAAAVLAPATIVLGTELAAVAQLAALVLLMVATLGVEAKVPRRARAVAA